MKKATKLLTKIVIGFILLVFAVLIIIPVFFKNTIKEKVVEEANKRINATLAFDDFSLSLIRSFPYLNFKLEEVSLVGKNEFEGKTLAGFKSFSFIFDLKSLTGKSGYRLKSLVIDSPEANAIILADGTANYDIMIETDKEPLKKDDSSVDDKTSIEAKEMKLEIKKVKIKKGHISFNDYSSGMAADIGSLNMTVSGNFSESVTTMLIDLAVQDIDFKMEGKQYLKNLAANGKFDIEADLKNKNFVLSDNKITVNDLIFLIDGSITLNEDESIATKLSFSTGKTEFKSLLSLIPAFFMEDYKNLNTEGNIQLGVNAIGVYDSRLSKMPVIDVDLTVNDGKVWYSGFPTLVNGLKFTAKANINANKISGNANLNIGEINANELMNMMPPSDTTMQAEQENSDTNTTNIEVVEIPKNIKYTFTANVDEVLYGNLNPSNIKASIIVDEGMLKIENSGLNILGGGINLDGLYDTRNIETPQLEAKLEATTINIKDSYDSFVTFRKLASITKGMDGSASVIFEFKSQLAKDMQPVMNSINGFGKFESNEIQLVNSDFFTKFSSLLNIGNGVSNTFKDIKVDFKVENGRVYFNPFDTKLGGMHTTFSGDHGIDQTINYIVSTEIPTSKMPSAFKTLSSELEAKAKKVGLNVTPPEAYNVNIGITGTVKDPKFKPSIGKPGESLGAAVKEQVKAMITEKVEEVKKEVIEKVNKEIDNAIEVAEKQAAKIKEEAAKAAQLIRDQAATQAQNLINEADSKGMLAKIAAKKGAEAINKKADQKASTLENEAKARADKLLDDAKNKVESARGKL